MAFNQDLWSELSEEWHSEPRSSPSSVSLPTYSGPSRQPVKDLQRGSRIPRSTSQLKSSKSPPARNVSQDDHSISAPLHQLDSGALSERSASDINSRPRSSPPNVHISKNPHATMHSRPSTISSAHSMVKHSSARARADGVGQQSATSEPGWKQLAMRKQDLFSPIGLEGVFQQRTPDPEDQAHTKSGLPFACDPGSMPSSPPLWRMPQFGLGSEGTPLGDTHVAHALSEIVEEQEDASRIAKVESRHQEATISDVNSTTRHLPSSQAHEATAEQANSQACTRDLSRPGRPLQRSVEMSGDGVESKVDIERRGQAPVINQVETISVSSPQSGIGNSSSSATGGFSPVFISKHNTVDGRVDYAAFDPSDLPSIGENVNQDRGGCSQDGSFRHRPLSPSAPSSDIPSDSVVPSDSVSQVHQRLQQPEGLPTSAEDAESRGIDCKMPQSVPNGKDVRSSQFAEVLEHVNMSDETNPKTCDIPELDNNVERAPPLGEDFNDVQRFQKDIGDRASATDVQSAETVLHMVDDDQKPCPRSERTELVDVGSRSVNNRLELAHHVAESVAIIPIETDASNPAEYLTRAVETQHQQLRAIIGKKRKDALYGDESRMSDDSMMIRRDILRPRNPTPGHGRRTMSRSTNAMRTMVQPDSANNSMPVHAGSVLIPARSREAGQIRALASEVATFKMHNRVAQLTGVRKQSVSTQDYIDEAMKIMDLIRARKNVSSNAASSDVTIEDDDQSEREHACFDGRSPLLSRPPSRDGPVSGWRSNAFEQVDSKVLDHLRQYEETGDDSFLVSSILRTVKISETAGATEQEGGFRITDHANSENFTRRNSDPAFSQATVDADAESHKTRHSDRGTDSSGRTVQTTSTQTTGNMARIAPENVSHLLNHEEAGMRYDTHRQTWVRTRNRTNHTLPGQPSSSVGTDEDILRQIPDLSVNDQDEQARSRTPSKNRPHSFFGGTAVLSPDQQQTNAALSLDGVKVPMAHHADTELVAQYDSSISQSRVAESPVSSSPDDIPEAHLTSSAENEVSLSARENLEDDYSYVSEVTSFDDKDRAKRREQSVFFSSPPVSRAWDAKHWIDSTSDDRNDHETSHEHDLDSSQIVPWKATRHGPSKRSHVDARPYRNAALSCVDERREISFTETRPEGRTMSLSLCISTPMSKIRQVTAPAPVSSGLRHQSFVRNLSPLSEFTLNQDDRRHKYANTPSQPLLQLERYEGRMTTRSSLTVKSLVEKLTNAEPNEPYWDFMSSLDLAHQGIDALHSLENLCPRLERLDASDNGLKHLEGAPASLRNLRLCNNALSSLTSWGHLLNLQYLDVSGNEITSLEACSSLLHLRDLKANNNRIKSIDGLLDMDGLLSLSLRHNELQEVDFSTADLPRLESLDISDNKLSQVRGLAALTRLQSLAMPGNLLSEFPCIEVNELAPSIIRSLRTLDLSCNALSFIDIKRIPRLRSLRADQNHLSGIESIETHESLRTLCFRNQTYERPGGVSSLDGFANLSHLYLSGTALPPLLPVTTPFLQLKTLDVSFTGLQALPREFGLLTPALQTLNLNSNSVRDLRPLEGIPGLRHLMVTGNRLGRLRMLMRVLKSLNALGGGVLQRVDFRDNPLCVGFYAPVGPIAPNGTALVHKNTRDECLIPDEASEETHTSTEAEDNDGLQAMSHILAPTSVTEDEQHLARLDDDTKMKRRVYELLLGAKCPRLKDVDGMCFDRARVEQRDGVWDALVGRGVVEQAAVLSDA